MIYPLIRNGFIGEKRLLCFMGAGGPEMHADAPPEPIDSQEQHLDKMDKYIDESDKALDEIDAGVEKLEDILTQRVEDLADASVDKAGNTVDRTQQYLISQIEGINDTIHVLIQEDKNLNVQSRRNIDERREANVTDTNALVLATEGRVLAEMGSQLTDRWASKHDNMIATGDRLDGRMEVSEGTESSMSWRKGEGAVAAADTTENKEEEKKKFVPSPSAEQDVKDIVLAMNIQNGSATGTVDAVKAFKDLKSEFASLEPDAKDAFVSWMNEQIGSLPYKAEDGLSGLRVDRTA